MQRTPEQVRNHYEVEKRLAATLKAASAQERRALYTSVNNELARLVPDHPMLTRKDSADLTERYVARQYRFIARFLGADVTYLEIGPGDCALSLRVAKEVKRVYAIDVSEELTNKVNGPDNFELVISDGTSIPVPENSVDVAFSDQLMEHLHPDDARTQLANIYRALKPGGRYVCITPNRVNGPHDVSKYFDDVATGFHLKEYSIGELAGLFSETGFGKVVVYAGGKGAYARAPRGMAVGCEAFLGALPSRLRRPLARTYPFAALLGIRLVGIK